MHRWVQLSGLMVLLLVPRPGSAQDAPPRLDLNLRDLRFDAPAPAPGASSDPARRCDGCPTRNLWRPFAESLAVNVIYNGINHARGHETARVSPRSWGANIKHGFEWDHNAWAVNQFGHPYQGSNYFTSGRAHGLTYWEASAVAAFGSATWEYFYENNRASFNDFINTTVGGIVVGEVLYRMAWAIRDPTRLEGRRKREMIALAIDPMSGLARTISGDINRVSEKPNDVFGRTFRWRGAAGVLWQGATSRHPDASARPFVDLDVTYGDTRSGRSTTPFEAFTVQFAIGGGPLTQSQIRGRLFGKPYGQSGNGQVTLFQTFDFLTSRAYAFGGQGFEVEAGWRREFRPGTSLWLAATGGATILAAADTLVDPPPGVTLPDPIGSRSYDYGPGARFGGVAEFTRHNRVLGSLSYQAFQVNVVDGRRAVHVLQRLHADVRVPVRRDMAIGATAEYFYRTAFFWNAGNRTDQSPQFRVFLAWAPEASSRSPQTASSIPGRAADQARNPEVSRTAKEWLGAKFWAAGGTGYSVARAGCPTCDRAGIFDDSRSFLMSAGIHANTRVDAGVEAHWVSLKVPGDDPIRTTFILGTAQIRPFQQHGLYVRAGMGIGIAGNGLYNPSGPALAAPFTTNALALTYGTGWIFRINRNWALQAYATHYIATLGELTRTDGSTIQNVVGNYWTIGTAIVIR